MSVDREVGRLEGRHVLLEGEVGHHPHPFRAENPLDRLLERDVAIPQDRTAREEPELDRRLRPLRDGLETTQVIAVDLLAAPCAVDDHRRCRQLRILELVGEGHWGLGTAGDQHKTLGIMLPGPISCLRLPPADPIVDLRAERAHRMAVVGYLDRRDPHVGQDDALEAHPNVGKIGHRKVVGIDGREVVGVFGGVVSTDLLKDGCIEVGAVVPKVHEHQVVVLRQGIDERLLGAVDALPLEPHRGQDGDFPMFWCVFYAAAAQGCRLEQPVNPLLHEIVALVIDVGSTEVGVVGEGIDADQAVVLVGDVVAKVLQRDLVGTAVAIALQEAEIPLGRQGRARGKEQPAVDLYAIARRIEGEQLREVSLLPEQDPHMGIGIAKLAHRHSVGNHAVQVDKPRCIGIAEDEVFLAEEVEQLLDERVETVRGGHVHRIVGDAPEVIEHLQKLLAHLVKVLFAVGRVEGVDLKTLQRILRRFRGSRGLGSWFRDGWLSFCGGHGGGVPCERFRDGADSPSERSIALLRMPSKITAQPDCRGGYHWACMLIETPCRIVPPVAVIVPREGGSCVSCCPDSMLVGCTRPSSQSPK